MAGSIRNLAVQSKTDVIFLLAGPLLGGLPELCTGC
jgi:hypothetical protein